ncbi:MAG: AAA family ATPase [Silvanigrellaceae bacterium]|nr:AAA family ATPase [Silvanigrellaceae bacterium]
MGQKNKEEYVTNESLKIESDTIDIMQRGKSIFESIVEIEEAKKIINSIHNDSIKAGDGGLNSGQKEAIEVYLTSNDRIIAWQGVAGAGKTFSLASATEIAKKNGYIVKGFAPQAEAAKVLAEDAKLSEAHTVKSLLVDTSIAGRASGKEIWIVDEAGTLSAKDAHDLLKKAEFENAKVLLVGDTKQLSSVGAGNPFKQLQEHGIKFAELSEGMRQKDKTLKESVDLIAKGNTKLGLEILEKNGKVNEIADTEKIIANMANDYLKLSKKDLESSLFISSTNYEKEQITNIVRSELKRKEVLKDSVEIKILESLGYNEYALRNANIYSKNDILILNKNEKGLLKNIEYRVLDVNHKNNTIIICSDDFKKEIDVSKIKGNLYQEKIIEISIGDKIKWTKNHSVKKSINKDSKARSERRLNGQYLNVIGIDKQNNTATIEYDKGKKESIDLMKSNFIDYNYVSTVFSSQGKTCNKVYASITNVDRENFYVAVSRARYDCKIYTNNKNILYRNVEKIGANKTAYDKIIEENKIQINLNNDKLKKDHVVKKFSENDLESIKISRKIKEKSFEISYKLGLDPINNDLGKFSKYGNNNQEIIANSIKFEINKEFGIDKSTGLHTLPVSTLKEIYSLKIQTIGKECQSQYFHKLNTNYKNRPTNIMHNEDLTPKQTISKPKIRR